MRVIIRFSLDGSNKAQTRLRRVLKDHLVAHGIKPTGKTTSTYQGDVSEHDIHAAIRGFWKEIANFIGNARLDHFWMYVDNPPSMFNLTPP